MNYDREYMISYKIMKMQEGERDMDTELKPIKFFEEAKKMLEEKDFVEFVSNISIAVETSRKDKEMLAKSTFLKAKGFIVFNQYTKALGYIEEALKYNTGAEAFELKKHRGVAKGFLGSPDEALTIFKELTAETDDINLLVGVYINIAWVHLTLKNNKPGERNLEEAKQYLDLANEHFDCLSNTRKWKVRDHYSVYYYYKKEYDKAIEILEDSIKYCEEQYLADVYSNLAEFYLKSDPDGISIIAKEYLEKAEVLATAYNNNLVLGYIFYTEAMIELRDDQLFTALDILYVSFEYFKKAEATVKACDCLMKINELMDEYKHSNLKSFRENLKGKLKDTPYCEKI